MTPIRDTEPHILQMLKGIEHATPVGAHRHELWERCWEENETPKYFSDVVRYHGALFHGDEKTLFRTMRIGIFEEWLAGEKLVSEFGCGSGDNLAALNDFHGTEVHGFDWAASSVKRCESRGIPARQFDMFQPHDIEFSGALLTVHALEQLGSRWQPFFDFMMRARPTVCVHIEPVHELYDPLNLLDYLALQYHSKRGYLAGFYSHLRLMEANEKIKLLHAERSHFGGLMHEAYSCLVWRPV